MFEFGHVGKVQTLCEHYVGKYPKREAIEFWRVGPKGKELPAIWAV